MKEITAEWLKDIPELKEVPIAELDWFVKNSTHYIIKEGDYLFKPGDPVKGTHIVVTGKIKIFITQGNSIKELGVFEPGDITGYLPFSRGKVANGTGQATEDTQMMTFPIERKMEIIQQHFDLTEALVQVMTSRVREFTAFQQQNEKMMALGKLSAGLSHELNNPAAAIVRGSTALKQHLKYQPETFKKVMAIQMTPELVDKVTDILRDVLARNEKTTMSLVERSACEDEVTDWLDEHNVENSMEISENLVEFGFTEENINEFLAVIPEKDLSPVLNWVNNNLVTEKMVQDIQEASNRISELVSAVKNYTHMDRAGDMQLTDIHFGLRNTLKMLNHKIKKGNIEVVENFDTTLPEVKAMVGELNQVWTNLLDNAIDAVEKKGKGRIEIKTERDREFVKVSIIDDGDGIPPEIMSRIFDPFFTTKEMGKGTGLGLDVVFRIIKQHNGTVKPTSVPGKTEFVVCFPMNGELK
ncbi:MAG TPA: ATP-binding protein [Flavobacteriales bacterium]|nr:ATP-binding protein [Flavobacteriales bacterium]